MTAPHLPVLPQQVLEHLARPEAHRLLDGTLGAGGHARLMLEALPEAELLGLDRDPDALALASEHLADLEGRVVLVQAPFAEAPAAVAERGWESLDGILLDLGVSSMQLDRPERGFSFQAEGPLDMRMNPEGDGETAAELVARLPEGELADVIYQLGEERHSRRIARAIVRAREEAPLLTTGQLADVVRRAMPRPRGKGPRRRRIDHATRTFQALRLAVNDELGQLERALPALFELLAPGGRMAIISFHSLEDRRVKHYFRQLKQEKRAKVLTKKPLVAGDEERDRNPRSRSAKLRVAERI